MYTHVYTAQRVIVYSMCYMLLCYYIHYIYILYSVRTESTPFFSVPILAPHTLPTDKRQKVHRENRRFRLLLSAACRALRTPRVTR